MIIGINEKPKTKLELFILNIQHVFDVWSDCVVRSYGIRCWSIFGALEWGQLSISFVLKESPIYLGVVLLTSEVL